MSARAEQARIRKLLLDRGIQFVVLSKQDNETVFRRFVEQFIENRKQESLILNFRRPLAKQKPIDYHRYFLRDCARDITWEVNKGQVVLLDWLSSGRKFTDCYLLSSEPWIVGLHVNASSLADRDLFFFPDSYWVSFEARRALALTRDAGTIACELKRGSSLEGKMD